MSASPASLMRRIYYVTILLALIAGGAYFASTLRYGWAETQDALESLFLPENEISIPADFPSDVPVYDPTKISVTLYGFDYSGGPKAHRLNYLGGKDVPFDTIAAYYRRELAARGWVAQDNTDNGGGYGGFDAEKSGFSLRVSLTTREAGVAVGLDYSPKNMKAATLDAEGAEIPDDFPSSLSIHQAAELFSYEASSDGGNNRHKAYFQVNGTEATLSELKAFYVESAAEEGWEKVKESSISKEYLSFSDGSRKLEIVIQPVVKSGSKEGGAPAYYQVVMETGSLANVASPPMKAGTNGDMKNPNEEAFEPLNLPDFDDLPNGYGYAPAIKELRARGVLGGYEDGTFKPGNPVNRAEFAKTIVGALGNKPTGKACFRDVKEEWYAPYACHAKEEGIIGGYPDGSFGPGRNVNYAEAIKIAMLAFGKMEDSDTEGWEWYDKYFNAAEERGYLTLIESIAKDDPTTPLSRGQMAQLIANLTSGEPQVAPTSSTAPKNASTSTMIPELGPQKVMDFKEFFAEHTPDPAGCPASKASGTKSFIQVITPNGSEKLEYATMLKAKFSASPDIRNARFGLIMPSGERPVLGYMNIACNATSEWMMTQNGPLLMEKDLPIKARMYVEGGKAYPDFTVSDESDTEFTIVAKP